LPSRQRRYNFRRISGYDILLPRWSHRTGRWHLTASPPGMHSEVSSEGNSPIEAVPLVRLPLEPDSPLHDLSMHSDFGNGRRDLFTGAFSGLRNRIASVVGGWDEMARTPSRGRRHRPRHGVLFFLPAIFTTPPDVELESVPDEVLPSGAALLRVSSRSSTPSPSLQTEKQRLVERSERSRSSGASDSVTAVDNLPPPRSHSPR
jgi:hypothetical protein